MAAPFRPCDHCPNPAVVHNTVIVDGTMHEVHLCEEHANAAGIQIPGAPPIGKLLEQFAVPSAARTKGPVCQRCGMSYAEHRTHGVLGCADCYQAFSATLDVVLDRAHGSTQHVGKAPPRVGDAQQRAAVLQQMLRELDEAVRAEQYERAARLRDRIKDMRPGGPVPGGTSPAGRGGMA